MRVRHRARTRWPGRALHLSVLMLIAGLAACEGGPKGPGTLNATVVGGPTLGAVVLEVTGPGIRGFTGGGDTDAFGALVSATEGRHRVVLVDAAGGNIEFGIEVDDVSADSPVMSVILAASTANAGIPPTGIEVRIGR